MTIGAFSQNIKVSKFKLVSENLPFHSSAVNIICLFSTVGMTTQNLLNPSTRRPTVQHIVNLFWFTKFRPLRWKSRRLTIIWSATQGPQSTRESFNTTYHWENINPRRATVKHARLHELWTVGCVCNGVRMFKNTNAEHCGASVSKHYIVALNWSIMSQHTGRGM